MTKYTYTNEMPYIYDPTRSGAKYSMDGGKTFKNAGEWRESITKFHRGLDYLTNPTTKFDEGSDIESLNASVKSSKATLACLYGHSFDEIVSTYFERVHSTLWIFVEVIDDDVVEYHMNAIEFRAFLEQFGALGIESGSHLLKVRIKATSAKMLAWLDERV